MLSVKTKFDEGEFVGKMMEIFPEAVREAACLDVEYEEFDQGWPNSAGGFCRQGLAVCDVLIHETTTAAKISGFDGRKKSKPAPELVVYGIFFGGRLAYAVLNPDEGRFLEDLRKRNPAPAGEAKELYGSECEEIWVLPPAPRRRIKVRGKSARR